MQESTDDSIDKHIRPESILINDLDLDENIL